LTLVLTVPFLRRLFHFNTLDPSDMLLCVAGGMVSIAWFEILKMLRVFTVDSRHSARNDEAKF
jgi:Ca2+-transporting ATPase